MAKVINVSLVLIILIVVVIINDSYCVEGVGLRGKYHLKDDHVLEIPPGIDCGDLYKLCEHVDPAKYCFLYIKYCTNITT
jgi:hypothetical protein